MRSISLILLLLVTLSSKAQVEVYRNSEDTATFIPPKDTITSPPVFGAGTEDFLRYLEVNINVKNTVETSSIADIFYFSFYVEKDGSLTDYELISFTSGIMAGELERAVMRMPEWTPGYLNGKKKRTKMFYKINIRKVNDFSPIEVTLNESNLQYTDKTKMLKIFITAGSVLILLTLWLVGK
jgi:hypothetical protein